jgi:hypothetical protein
MRDVRCSKKVVARIPWWLYHLQGPRHGRGAAGQLVLVEGKRRKRTQGERQWAFIVSGSALTPVLAPTAVEGH